MIVGLHVGLWLPAWSNGGEAIVTQTMWPAKPKNMYCLAGPLQKLFANPCPYLKAYAAALCRNM